jgi:hypothetical protein
LLGRAAALYDETTFEGALGEALASQTDRPLAFRLSNRLLRAGGVATRKRDPLGAWRYQVSLSLPLLRGVPAPDGRPVVVVGLACTDRLAAMQRLLEHELLHVVEWLAFDRSNCRSPGFLALAFRAFGHTERLHRLPTPRDVAAGRHGIDLGDRVSFTLEDGRYEGVVMRIGHRVTVQIEHEDGVRAPDGRCYLKAYVPVDRLEVVRRAAS